MIELTSAGRRQFEDRQFSESLLRKYMRDEESICVWLGPMDYTSAKRQFDSRDEVVEAINNRARKYDHADQTITDPLDVPFGTTSKKVARKTNRDPRLLLINLPVPRQILVQDLSPVQVNVLDGDPVRVPAQGSVRAQDQTRAQDHRRKPFPPLNRGDGWKVEAEIPSPQPSLR